MNRFFYVIIFFAIFMAFTACDTPLNKYAPQNDAEKNIVELLKNYLDSRNTGDIDRLAAMFHDNGLYIAGNGAAFTKKEIAESTPEWWVQYGQVDLLNPEFRISDHQATVYSTGKFGHTYKTPHVFTLIIENGHWCILKIKTGN